MSGILDIHTILAIQNGWKFYMTPANKAIWKGLFPGIRDDTLNEWYTALGAKVVDFRTWYASGSGEFPAVVVELAEEENRDGEEPMGGSAGTDGGHPVYTMLVNQTVRITCFFSTPELSRMAHATIRAILHASLRRFVEAGYLSMQYKRAEPLSPEEETVAEDMGMFVRKQVWSTIAQIDSPSLEATDAAQGEWFLNLNDVKSVQNPDTHQPAPVDQSNIDPETGKPYLPNRIPPDEGVAGDDGGVVL